jgi:hypothetical protein
MSRYYARREGNDVRGSPVKHSPVSTEGRAAVRIASMWPRLRAVWALPHGWRARSAGFLRIGTLPYVAGVLREVLSILRMS